MSVISAKQEFERLVQEFVQTRISAEPPFVGDNAVSYFLSQSVIEFRHPSILFSTEHAETVNPDLYLFMATCDVYVTSLALDFNEAGTVVDSIAVHRERVGMIEDSLSRYADIIALAETISFGIRILSDGLEVGSLESFQDEHHWVDKVPLIGYFQMK